jgi:hypothetical protein
MTVEQARGAQPSQRLRRGLVICGAAVDGYHDDMPVLACPSCSTTDAVRAEVLGEGFWGNLGVLALPLVIVALIGGAVHRSPLRPRGRRS